MSRKTRIVSSSIGIFFVSFYSVTSLASAAVIANWRFEPGANFLVDSSGNGHTLTGTATQDTAVADVNGGTGSALFNGTSNGLHTASALDLSAIAGTLRVSFALRKDGGTAPSFGIVFEHSTNYGSNAGAFYVDVNEISTGTGAVGWRLTSPPASDTINAEQFPHATNLTWDLYQIDFVPTSALGANVIQATRNGVLLADTTAFGRHGTTSAQSFINSVFYIGARGGTSSFFKGNIDELKIETLVPAPEPTSGLMLLVGLTMLCLRRVRRK